MTLTKERAAEVAHAREVDTEVARLWGEFWKVQNQIVQLLGWAEDKRKWAKKPYNQNERYQAEAEAEIVKYTDQAEALMPEANSLKQAAMDYDKANYGGWTRFYLVQHIHNSTYCPSFRPTTRVGWLPDVSGLTEAEAVAAHGETLCTKCFPDAPVALTTKAADPDTCPGSGGMYDREKLTGREKAHYSPAGYCPVCGEWTSLTARFSTKLRKHKKPGAK